MELLGSGRMAEVFAVDDARVVKLDRPEWNGVSAMESEFITLVSNVGPPVARSHGVVTIDGRCGVMLDRLDGQCLLKVVNQSTESDVESLAERFVTLQGEINATKVDGFANLVDRLRSEIQVAELPSRLVNELVELLTQLDDGTRGVCHYDYHPGNVIVATTGWFVIDWLGVASGPLIADLARTILLVAPLGSPRELEFSRKVRRLGLAHSGLRDESILDAWIRIVAAARLAEAFTGTFAGWLRDIAVGTVMLGR